MNHAQSCQDILTGEETLSAFADSLQHIEQQAGEYCLLHAQSENNPKGFWLNLQQLIESGYSNLATNYELLVSGEIGAIYVVALIPLLLGVILEIMLIISNKRKERHIEQRQHQKLTLTHGRAIANQVIQSPSHGKRIYGAIKYLLATLQILLIALFFIAVPEYDRDVWCEEHKTQYAIIMAGLETEKLQQWQRKANCEIQLAVVAINESVDALGNVFSKENQTTLKSLKQVSSNVNNSLKKLDTTKKSIDSFNNRLEVANLNSDSVIETLNTLEQIAFYLGAKKNPSPLPIQLEEFNLQVLQAIEQRPSLNWSKENLAKQKDVSQLVIEQKKHTKEIQGLTQNQKQNHEVTQKHIEQLHSHLKTLLLSDEFINTLSARVSEKVQQQSYGPILLKPEPESPALPAPIVSKP